MTNLLSRIYDAANNVVTANVDNQSVNTGEATIGGTGPVSGIFGDEGEYVPLTMGQMRGGAKSTSDTTYTAPLYASNRPRVLNPNILPISGFDSYHVVAWGEYGSDQSGATATLRIVGKPSTEISTTDAFAQFSTGPVEFDPSTATTAPDFDPEIKTSDSTYPVDLYSYHIAVVGRVK